MIVDALLSFLITTLGQVVKLLPSFNFTFPQSAVDYIFNTISSFGFVLPVPTIVTIFSIEIGYRMFMLSAKLIKAIFNKIISIVS